MNVVLPEVDGRIGTRAISFKAEAYDAATDSRVATYEPVADRVRFVAAQAAAWVRLGAKPAKDRRVAIVLSNYPNRASRGSGMRWGSTRRHRQCALTEAHEVSRLRLVDAIPRDGVEVTTLVAAFTLALCAPRSEAGPPARSPTTTAVVEVESAISARSERRRMRGASLPRPIASSRLPAAASAVDGRGGGRRKPTRLFATAASPSTPVASATSCWRCSRRGATTSTRRPACMTARSCRRMATSPSMPGCATCSRPTRRPSRQARQSRMAAGEGAGAVGGVLAGAVPRSDAADLSLHRQRSRRRGAGQAARRRR